MRQVSTWLGKVPGVFYVEKYVVADAKIQKLFESALLLGVDYTCVLDVQFECAFPCRMRFRCHFQCRKLNNDIKNAFDSETPTKNCTLKTQV
jgi:hypothetical protein